MSNSLRGKLPIRTFTKTYSTHTSYKNPLRNDFNKKCGYCDDEDTFVGGPGTYHVDHFAPYEHFPHLRTVYGNLVYSCRFCNRAKWNKWPSTVEHTNVVNDEGFIDPCDPQYDSHFERDATGKIIAITDLGIYMHKNLNLHLERHSILWRLSSIQEKQNTIKELEANGKTLTETQKKLLSELDANLSDFYRKLQNTYNQ